MTSARRRPDLLALAVLAMTALAGCAGLDRVSVRAVPPRTPPPAAYALAQRIARRVRAFHGRVGVAVEEVSAGWTAADDGDALLPQQSVAKLCTALAVLGAVDAGRLGLDEPVVVRREDMSVFNQPIQAELKDGPFRTTVRDLLRRTIAQSDNAADDVLIRRVGGSGAVQADANRLGLSGVRCGPEERVLQSRIAGLDWRPEYSWDRAFWTARDALPMARREAAMHAYLADPPEGATPLGLVRLLGRLRRGELLSPPSTGLLLQIMGETRTGPQRLPAGLRPGWSIAHKTGTGQDLGPLSTGNNDVGLLTAPDGRVYAVAVMIASTEEPVPARQRLGADVARAVTAAHDGR